MITFWIMQALAEVLGGMIGLMPALPTFTHLDSVTGWVVAMRGWMVPLTFWIPFPLAIACALVVLPMASTGAAIKGGRLLISHFSGGGGSAG